MKKVNLLLFSLFFITQLSFGQEETRFHFGVQLNPKLTQPMAESDVKDDQYFNYSLGLEVFYDLSPRVQLRSGVNFSQLMFDLVDNQLVFGCDIDPVSGIVDQDQSYLESEINTYYVGIPLDAKWKLVGEKNHLYGKTGLEALFKIHEEEETVIYECGTNILMSESNPQYKTNTILLKARVGLGYAISLGGTKKMYIEPQAEYSLTNVFKEAGIINDFTDNRRVFEMGVLVGVNF